MKTVDWSEDHYGEGIIIAVCDQCGKEAESDPFFDNDPDYKAFQAELRKKGWTSTQVNYRWKDFCCESCRNQFIKRFGG
ncbi:MAG: hypothetical protein IKP95_09260 [Ruminococcus sp.]|nr:hypothetical protein [Ruminococcus sp.]